MHSKGKVKVLIQGAEIVLHQAESNYPKRKEILLMIRYSDESSLANAERIAAFWNAADGMTTEEATYFLKFCNAIKNRGGIDLINGLGANKAVKYLEHGPEMVTMLSHLIKEELITGGCDYLVKDLLAKLEGES